MSSHGLYRARVIRAADYREMPWANRQGTTREIAIYPEGATLAARDFIWRAAQATVPGGRVGQTVPFSGLPGCDRLIVMLSGGIALDHGIVSPDVALYPFEPHAFRGEWSTEGTLLAAGTGPIKVDR